MRKLIVLVLCLMIVLSACSASKNGVLESLGEYNSKEYYISDGIQDYTAYAKYTYEAVDLSANPYFNQISSSYEEDLLNHIEDFEEWIDAIKFSDAESEVVVNYDFAREIISEDDFVYIYDDPDYPELGYYDVYFIDVETMTMYYFHNNI